jgi:hypothetical protein
MRIDLCVEELLSTTWTGQVRMELESSACA